jgi:hypothetical protein
MDAQREADTVKNLTEQVDLLRSQLVAASREAERRELELRIERDVWRERAQSRRWGRKAR